MKASDLRVGNYVWEEYGGIYKVVNINSEGFDYIDLQKPTFKAIGRYSLDSIDPIPLTQEILSKIPSIDGWIIDNRFECRKNFGDSVSIYAWKNGKSIFIVDLNFLHELQNWYYLHARKELEIKL